MTTRARHRIATCFFEQDPEISLRRRMFVEGVGTLLLMLAATGAGLTAHHLSAKSPGLGLLLSAVTTAGALVGLIVALGQVSGGHFNPLITGLQCLAGERRLDCTLAYVTAQLFGAGLGAVIAGALFDAPVPTQGPMLSVRTALASEMVASAGLMIVVFGCARSGRREAAALAVGAWLTAAIIATPSGSYANPAIAIAAIVAAGPVALPSPTALFYAASEVAGALLALAVIQITYPIGQPKTRSFIRSSSRRITP
jgi:glycerol uptake facilitator-like aquaporin